MLAEGEDDEERRGRVLDGCDGTDAGLARCFAALVGRARFRYVGEKRWEQWDAEAGAWAPDPDRRRLLACVATEFSGAFLARAQWWQRRALDGEPDPLHAMHERNFVVQRLLAISARLRGASRRSALLRELAAWLDAGAI